MLRVAKQISASAWSLIDTPKPEQILNGDRLFRPVFKCQRAWIRHFHPDASISKNTSVWQYLQRYVMPLIKQHASSYHLEGIRLLQLDAPLQPEFDVFQNLFYQASNGFIAHPVQDEIEPKEYFALIQQKKFPCISAMRSHDEIFCAKGPDFWHEAMGHLAPLCCPEVQQFYLNIADVMLSPASDAEFKQRLAVAWTLTEYGFIKQNGQPKMFGAAMVGSHLAHRRYLQNMMVLEPADSTQIISSGFYEEEVPIPRDEMGRMRYFCLDDFCVKKLFN